MTASVFIRHLKYVLHLRGNPGVTHADVDKLAEFAASVYPIARWDEDPAWWARLFWESIRREAGSADDGDGDGAEVMTPAVVRRVVLMHESGAADEFLGEWFERCRERRGRGAE